MAKRYLRCDVGVAVLVLLLATQAAAQLQPDSWLLTTPVGAVFPPQTGGISCTGGLGGQTAPMQFANAVHVQDSAEFWYCDGVPFFGTGSLRRALLNGSTVVGEEVLCSGVFGAFLANGAIAGMVRVRDQLWFATDLGILGWLSPAGSGQTPHVTATWGFAAGQLRCVATDGRELFVGSAMGSTALVSAYDLLTNAGPRTVAQLPGGEVVGLGGDFDGSLIACALDGSVHRVDPLSGTFTTFAAPSPGFTVNAASFDPWTQQLCACGSRSTPVGTSGAAAVLDLATLTWTPLASFGSGSVADVAAAAPVPYERFGLGCSNATGLAPRIGTDGAPARGGSFALLLQGAEPSSFAFVWLGASRTNWPGFGALPFPGATFGAPGCDVLASIDALHFVPVDAAGNARQAFAVPPSPALAGVRVFGQWASATIVNAFGLATSDAVAVHVR